MDLRSILLTALAAIPTLSCGETRASDRELIARSAGGDVYQDLESDGRFSGIDLPESLRPNGDLIGRGVCVPVGEPSADGSRRAHRTGEWTYEYVRTTKTKDADGKPLTHFTDLEASSLGIEARGSFVDNRAEGEWRFWHRNGRKRAVGRFVAGEMSGTWKFWREDGAVDPNLTGTYEHGRMVGGKQ